MFGNGGFGKTLVPLLPEFGLSGDPSFLLPEFPAFVESIGKAHMHGYMHG